MGMRWGARASAMSGMAAALSLATLPAVAAAPGAEAPALGVIWGLPFIGMLLSIALMPLLAARLWHHHYGKIAGFWAALFLLPFAIAFGPGLAADALAHVALGEYLPFITLLLALYVTGGGVLVQGHLPGSPAVNTALLAVGTVLASIMGTTGASMVMIRPLIRANSARRHRVHTFVFFIFLVSNLGGSLTPLGDPPLYLGFLKGVSFFWPTQHLMLPFLFCAGLVLALYWLLDTLAHRKEAPGTDLDGPREPIRIAGRINLLLLAAVVGIVLMQGLWQPGSILVLGQELGLERLLAMLLLLGITLISVRLTPDAIHAQNGFSWDAIAEVAKLFAAIFITMAPVLAMLKLGAEGPFAGLVALTSAPDGTPYPAAYFWLTGALSSFLDNAPTYLVFFNLAGGEAAWLMGQGAPVLVAISAGAVFMGANSYIGNAPNFMVKAIVEGQGIRMPSFFGYCAWACAVLVPVFALATILFF